MATRSRARGTPTSGRPGAQPRTPGFTLIELLVVIVIIGLIAAGAVLSLGAIGQDRQLQQERDRLAALIGYARERGGILTLEYGIRCGRHGYRFVRYDDTPHGDNTPPRWIPETVDETLRPRRLPDGLQLTLIVEGRPVALDDAALQFDARTARSGVRKLGDALGNAFGGLFDRNPAGGDQPGGATTDNLPQILLFSNGDTNSFSLTIERENVGRTATLSSSPDGAVHVGDIVESGS